MRFKNTMFSFRLSNDESRRLEEIAIANSTDKSKFLRDYINKSYNELMDE